MKKYLKNPLVIIILIIGLVYILGDRYNRKLLGDDYGKDYSDITEKEHFGERDAYRFSKEKVLELLKAPSTAKFPIYEQIIVTTIGIDKYRVSAYVDSQNSFGAMIRQKYSCEIEFFEENEKTMYRLTNFKFD